MTIHAERLTEALEAEATGTEAQTTVESTETPLVEEESLVEEISIDGMCGVY